MTRPRTVRLNLTAAYIPLVSRNVGDQSIVRSVEDTNYVITNAYSGEGADKDIGIPMIVYAENIMPAIYGVQSVGYKAQHGASDGNYDFDQVHVLRFNDESRALFVPAAGKNYINTGNSWVAHESTLKYSGTVTTAYIKQNTFVCYKRTGIFEYIPATGNFQSVLFTGLDTSQIDGITAANSYTIAWSTDTIYWSSAINPRDFVPSLSSGAGSSNVLAVRGAIVCCLPVADGYIIYTTENAVYARYTQNIRFPWNFTEIPGSAGINKPEEVSFEANHEGHFAWTHSGLQIVTREVAKNIFPEITDFILSKRVEEWIGQTGKQDHQDEVPNLWSSISQEWTQKVFGENLLIEHYLSMPAHIKLAFIASRYLAISYGYRKAREYDYVIVYDFALKRFGKLKINHVDCFHYVTPNGFDITAKDTFGFLKFNGEIVTLDLASATTDSAVMIFGGLRHTRGKDVYLLGVDVSNVNPNAVRVTALPSIDGYNYEEGIEAVPVLSTKDYTEFHCNCVAQTFGLEIRGTFELSSLLLTLQIKGSRKL